MERRILILSAGAFFAVLLAGAFFQPGMLGFGRAASDDPAGADASLAIDAQDVALADGIALSTSYDNDDNYDDYDDDHDAYDDDDHHDDDDHDDHHDDGDDDDHDHEDHD